MDIVVRLIEAQGAEMALDFELAPNVYSKAKVCVPKELPTRASNV